MKRFHVHVHVEDLQASINFYQRLFAAQPTRIEADWMTPGSTLPSPHAAASPVWTTWVSRPIPPKSWLS
jgi:hypothetical protein